MFDKIMNFLYPSEKLSDLEQYILSKNPQTVQDVEYWTRMYDLRPRFVTNHLMPMAGMLR
jgi:hypothetical protein